MLKITSNYTLSMTSWAYILCVFYTTFLNTTKYQTNRN